MWSWVKYFIKFVYWFLLIIISGTVVLTIGNSLRSTQSEKTNHAHLFEKNNYVKVNEYAEIKNNSVISIDNKQLIEYIPLRNIYDIDKNVKSYVLNDKITFSFNACIVCYKVQNYYDSEHRIEFSYARNYDHKLISDYETRINPPPYWK